MSFVFVTLQRINTDRESTSTSLAKELSKNHKVLYVNPPIDRRTMLRSTNDKFISAHIDEIKRKENNLHKLDDNLWMYNPHSILESINWIPSTKIFSMLNLVNNRRFANEIGKAINALGIKKYILINDKDIFRSFHLKELLNPLYYIYLYRDYTLAFDYWKRHGRVLEPELMKKADCIVCNSHGFTEMAKGINQHSYYIGNGCNTDLFNGYVKWEKPAELARLSGPVVGYCGALTESRLDIDLLVHIAKSRPQWNLVLVGDESPAFRKSALHHLQNVHFLGKKNTKDMPAYISHFDVCINPQTVNELTRDNYPLKIDEYLAMGRPVVATATKAMYEVFADHVYLADSNESYVRNIERALAEDNDFLKEARVSFANTHTWKNVMGRFLNSLKMMNRDTQLAV
ncbi:MAG: glycosyltransferase family 1 protein [Sphingobacteriales bacterium]|nr:MAG: glycosyltransferase family 1 protein [Sphingobacteriales bacterium]